MITVFNRKRVLSTYDLAAKTEVCQKLEAEKIDFYTRVINRMSASPVSAGSRARVGTFGNDLSKMYEYIIYVKKSDAEKAAYLINRK
jgi:hypothetical protein